MRAAAALILITLSASAQLHDEQYPRRIINGATVNLTPLFESQAPESERPLRAWKKLTGVKVSDCAYGWVILSGGERCILKNPPASDWQQFQTLKNRYMTLNKKAAQLRDDLKENKIASAGIYREKATIQSIVYTDVGALERARTRESELSSQRHAVGYRETANNTELNAIYSEVNELHKSGYNLDGDFPIACYTLDTKSKFQTLPIYDRGAILK